MSPEQKACEICQGTGLVCEDHPDKAWRDGEGCCGGAGKLCICLFTAPQIYDA